MANRKRLRIDSDNTSLSQRPISKRLRSMPPKGKQKQTDTPTSSFRVDWEDKFDRYRTDRLLNWLDEHPTERHRLFSDSSKAAQQEQRPLVVNKSATQKTAIHAKIAQYVFENDQNPEYRNQYASKPEAFTGPVGNRLGTYAWLFLH